MNGAVMRHKCRRCGEITGDCHVPDGTSAMISVVFDSPLPSQWGAPFPLRLVGVHSCRDGGLGVSDLIGCEFDEKVPR